MRKVFGFGLALRSALNTLFYRYAGGDRRPVFHEIDDVSPALRRLEESFDAIRAEVEALLPRNVGIPEYHEIDATQEGIAGATPNSWRVLMLYVYGADELPNRELCPRTMELVGAVPNVVQAFFSILEPRKTVPSHNGPYFGFLRYHLPLVVPAENPPTLRVKDCFHTWKEREGLVFDDTWNHEVLNESDGFRVVLSVDVLRPMPWPLQVLNRFWFRYKAYVGAYPELERLRVRPAPEGAA